MTISLLDFIEVNRFRIRVMSQTLPCRWEEGGSPISDRSVYIESRYDNTSELLLTTFSRRCV